MFLLEGWIPGCPFSRVCLWYHVVSVTERSGAMRKPTVTDRSVEKLVGVYTVLAHMVTDILSLCGYLLFIVLTFVFDWACFKLKINQLPLL